MPQKCESISYCNPAPYRQPRSRTANPPPVWRFTTMHLKSCPKPQEKEIHREALHDGIRSLHADQQGVFRKEWCIRQACGLKGSPGMGATNRSPLRVLSTNTLRCSSNSGDGTPSRVNGTRKTKAPSVSAFTSPVMLLSPSTDMENESSLQIYQEGVECSLDIWTVIKPGNTKEKIAMFAAEKCSDAPNAVTENTLETEAVAPELRSVSVKNKGSWDGDWSVAKRRKRSGTSEKPRSMETLFPTPELHSSSQVEPSNENVHPCHVADEPAVQTEGEEDGKMVSVVEMVAYLEQRASDTTVSSKPLNLRSTSSITLSKVGSIPLAKQLSKSPEQAEIQDEDGEAVRVLDMVAKLESQCQSRRTVHVGGELSRNNSLRRKVGRVLLAGSEPYSLPSEPTSPSVPSDKGVDLGPQELSLTLGTFGILDSTIESTQFGVGSCTLKQEQESPDAEPETGSPPEIVKPFESLRKPVVSEVLEGPLPGMLFFATSAQPLRSQNKEPCQETSASSTESDRRVDQIQKKSEMPHSMVPDPVPFPRRLVSHEFLEARFKIQLLLEPQQYMAFLPHHIIVKIFSLLPTKSLAALKCTCHYFKFIIESYGLRPADSRWVRDPRYKDDPCKQCKKRYHCGDVSLCRWHHKPYCQAMPYGRGYWMCCRVIRKDAPGCNVGLHDNRWVPAFHSINMPMYKKSREWVEDS